MSEQREHGPERALEGAVREALSHAGHLLPDQAPIRVFIHHNTLHAFQHLHFHDAVRMAKRIYGAEPYMSEARFREELARGRITREDLDAALSDQGYGDDRRELFPGLLDARGVRRALLRHAVPHETGPALSWMMRERGLTTRLRDDLDAPARERLVVASVLSLRAMLEGEHKVEGPARLARLVTGQADPERANAMLCERHGIKAGTAGLVKAFSADPEPFVVSALWTTCVELAQGYSNGTATEPSSRILLHRDLVLAQTDHDIYDHVLPALIRWSGAYLDDGLAAWPMPSREAGFYRSVRQLMAAGSSPARWLDAVHRDFRGQLARNSEPLDVVLEILTDLGVGADQATTYVETLLLTLPGWAGMMSRLERHPEDRPAGAPPASLLDWLAVRLTYDRAALRTALPQALGARNGLRELWKRAADARSDRPPEGPQDVAYRLFQLVQLAGVPLPALLGLSRAKAHELLGLMDGFDELTRRRLFQEAYEHHHRVQVLSALSQQRRHVDLAPQAERARFQVISCFDEREESLRRQLEELAPDCQTYGAPGFFGAAMRFRGLDEPVHVPLAPVVIKPTHHIEEHPHDAEQALLQARAQRRRLGARLAVQLQVGSRSLWRGMLLNTALGLLAALPLLMRVLSPRNAGRIKRWTSDMLLPSPRTEVRVHRDVASDAGPLRGFDLDERSARVATMLQNIGLVCDFAPVVVVLGHGSTTLNNPHKSAYDCGACGGRQGGPNARVFSQMANDGAVRAALAGRGIVIPDDTVFVGGQHDTCNDVITMFDLERVPEAQRQRVDQALASVRQACARTAEERCRRLFSAPAAPTPDEAIRHVAARSEHLAEPRPEFGHATNAIALVGRRALTRGLFLDRRAFLISYDPTIDDDGAILERTLAAATPVGAGINLEYYFSHVDNEIYGAGSKLPHNVTGLIGVMSGHASDLRTGLPRQMIEIHEPLRLLVIVEATPERLLSIAARQAEVAELVTKRWVQLVALDPDTGAMHVFTDRGFEPFTPEATPLPQAATSRDFYLGKHDYLPPARIVGRHPRAA